MLEFVIAVFSIALVVYLDNHVVIYTRKCVENRINEIEKLEWLHCLRSAKFSMDSYYPWKMHALHNRAYDIRYEYRTALERGWMIKWRP